MNLSLNEVEAMAKKAARGGGFDWGVAEEAGKAVRWLCQNGIDGCAALAELLSTDDAEHCALRTGLHVTDFAETLRESDMDIGPVNAPELLLPFVASAALQLETPLTLLTSDQTYVTDGRRLDCARGGHTDKPDTVKMGGVLKQPTQPMSRANPDAGSWAVLGRFAHKTYAPATEESRLRGAGAGVSDND